MLADFFYFLCTRIPKYLELVFSFWVVEFLRNSKNEHRWNFMQTHHAFLGILYFNKVDEGKDFSLLERRLFLGMAIFAAWFGVYLKYFYLRRWIPMFFDEVLDDLHLFPGDWLEDHLDSAVCSALGGAVDLLLGKEIVRSVLKKDWETKGGVRGFASSLATAYAALLVVGGVAHIFYVMVLKPKLQFKLLLKLGLVGYSQI